MQFVAGQVAAFLYQLALGQAYGLTDSHAWGKHMLGKSQVHHLVIGSIYGAGGAKKGYAAAFTVQHHGLADILFLSVEGHNVARGCHPQWQVVALLTFKVG